MKPLSLDLVEPRDTEYRPLLAVYQVLFRMAVYKEQDLVANQYIVSNTPTLPMQMHKYQFEEKHLD